MEGKQKRFFVLDLMRGLVVFLMIVSHTVYFFHNYTSDSLIYLEKFGNFVAFTTFLLISGAVFYIAYLKNDKWSESKKKLKKRFLVLLLSYYAVAFFIEAGRILTTYGFDRWTVVSDILSFRFIPSYTEYIPPFIFYSLIVLFAHKLFTKISKSFINTVLVSLALYLVGYLVYITPTYEFLIPWKAFLGGAEGYYRFPVLQYSSVFLIGIYWGNVLYRTKKMKQKVNIVKTLSIFTFVSLGVITLATIYFKSLNDIFLRWPPTIPFILVGLNFTFFTAFGFYKLKLFNRIPLLRDGLLVFGQNALGIFWAHIFLLHLYQMSGGTKVGSIPIFLALLFLTVVFSLVLAAFIPFNFKFSLTFHKGSREDEVELLEKDPLYRFSDEIAEETEKEIKLLKRFFFPRPDGTPKRKKLIRKRHLMGLSVVFIIASFIIFPSVLQEREKRVKSAQVVTWWSDEYGYNASVKIKNNESFSGITKGQILKFSFDHKKLVSEKKSLRNGNDIRVVYWDGRKHKEVDYWIENNWNQANTTLRYENPEIIPSGQEREVYLYYGNAAATSFAKSSDSPALWQYKYKVVGGVEESYPYLIEVGKLWSFDSDKELGISLKSDSTLVNPRITYRVIGSGEKGRMKANERDIDIFESTISLEDLTPGIYQVQATIVDGGSSFTSQKAAFYITQPLYVTWTQDWEGYDVSEIYLMAMDQISKKHSIPMTHLFSPRIYMALSKDRQDILTNYVKEKELEGDEIGLHLHMFYDFIEKAGVTPKKEPNWGDKGDGYGALTLNYSETEMTKILKSALSWFESKGLTKPISYRAGGWFASEDTLKALDNVGIKIDTSGRTSYEFGNNKIKGPWNLSATTEPYHPSLQDQNVSSKNDLGLWEVPNNGADSYWFKADEMIDRFNQNYNGEILLDRKQVTYLTHPHWFNKGEQDRIDTVFNYIDNFKYENDSGPVKYVTLKDIYNEWLSKE